MSFSFKQFTIQQNNCAMKVCTDACLFAAWVAAKLEEKHCFPQRVLDIGTGTGLLSLMLAQKTNAHFDALEIDKTAAAQAKENVAASPWQQRVQIITTDVTTFTPQHPYDLIISNPPFYEADLRSANAAKNAAKHDTTLTIQQLFKSIITMTATDAIVAILVPWHRSGYTVDVATAHGFFLNNQLQVKQTPTHQYFRSMLIFSKKSGGVNKEEMIIHDKERNYTEAFKKLLKDYYLKL